MTDEIPQTSTLLREGRKLDTRPLDPRQRHAEQVILFELDGNYWTACEGNVLPFSEEAEEEDESDFFFVVQEDKEG